MLTLREAEISCPVSPDVLGELYRAGPKAAGHLLQDVPEADLIQLALFCYGRTHLRDLGLTVAATCDPVRLTRAAGTLGEVLVAQSLARQNAATRPKGISLAGTLH